MIRRLKIQNFKAIRSAEIELERFTVLVGPNASGKTSILQALEHLAKAARLKRDVHTRELVACVSRASNGPVRIEAAGVWGNHPGLLKVTLDENNSAEAYQAIGDWVGHVIFNSNSRVLALGDEPVGEEEVRASWASTRLLRLDPASLAKPSVSEGEDPHIEIDGSGLASVLAQMALNRPDDFTELTSAVRRVIPLISRIRLSLAQIRREEEEVLNIDGQPMTRMIERSYGGHRLLLDMVGASGVPGEDVSEGTMLVLGLLAVVMGPSRPSLLLLDDLDRGLHPRAQRDLVSQLRELLARFPDMQIVGTSHSPYLVDCMEPEEVRLTTVSPEGVTYCAPLKDHPRFEEWKDVMRPGEFWSTVGEDWVKSPAAAPQGNA